MADTLATLLTERAELRAEIERLQKALRRVMEVGDRSAVAVAFEALGDAAEWTPVPFDATNNYRVDL